MKLRETVGCFNQRMQALLDGFGRSGSDVRIEGMG
jgi:hypothetical protein